MWDWHCGVCTGSTVGSVGSSWETFEGRKGIIAHALEEYLSFMSEYLWVMPSQEPLGITCRQQQWHYVCSLLHGSAISEASAEPWQSRDYLSLLLLKRQVLVLAPALQVSHYRAV